VQRAFFKKYLTRELFQLPCRHHINEIILKSVFELKYSTTSAPEVPLFNRFAATCEKINQQSFQSGIDDPHVR